MSSEFETFVSDIDALRRSAQTEAELVGRVADRLARLNRAERWLPADFRQPCTEGYKQHVVYVAPDASFSVCSLVWCEQQATPIHDHAAWCVVGVYEGAERETRYRLEGSGSGQRLVAIGTHDMSAGETAAFAADGTDVHKVTNPTRGLSISIHVYGADISRLGTSIKHRFDHLPVIDQAVRA
jgi:predicted metal-dependent enzyme (double-stranded beta helix superfamily)